mmetsp:Transcript_28762/g.56497  ORF Transcript_28762/g.56497 Transcript_28762/m.56497 type:complete len:584 (-) Transcript_28762:45-1796(-)|eukprot:CAMPEP_0175142086 /NCGR_PEP_ID=MMETSP0087-20121206/12556_1 /TAXON_ID=136419 /ORGANISM="Unknown Unknown, Strain D1" /LENGTH=583 /DNA_ID=CAMNT_0016425755 /DNA_START=30 /DNA_END=1781 /DNA_ORIENTATION=-
MVKRRNARSTRGSLRSNRSTIVIVVLFTVVMIASNYVYANSPTVAGMRGFRVTQEFQKSDPRKLQAPAPPPDQPPAHPPAQQPARDQPSSSFPAFPAFDGRWTRSGEKEAKTVPWAPSRFQFAHNQEDKDKYTDQGLPKPAICKTKNLEETCSWEMANRFFKFETRAPQLSPAAVADMKFTVIDAHGGPLLDTMGFLEAAGVKKENIKTACPIAVHCRQTDTSPELEGMKDLFHWSSSDWMSKPDSVEGLKKRVREHMAANKVPKADVVICLYPGHQCIVAQEMGKFVIIRFMLRWQQYNYNEHKKYGKWLQSLVACGHGAVAASSAYDFMHIKHYLGIDAFAWPSLAPHVKPAPDKHVNNGLVFTQLQPYTNDKFSGMFYTKFLFQAAHGGLRFDLKHVHWVGNGDAPNYPAVYITAYGAQVTKFVEFYMSGCPLIAPGHTLLTQWHKEHGYVMHRSHNLSPNTAGYHFPYHDFPEALDSPCCGTNPELLSEAQRWLWFVDHLQWPNTLIMENWQDLRKWYESGAGQTENQNWRAEHIKTVQEWRNNITSRVTSNFRSLLQFFVDNEQKGDICKEAGNIPVI